MRRDVSALILAGGLATRLGGVAKHLLVVDGATILARQTRLLAPRVAEILISGPDTPGLRSVHDTLEGAGPLAGIAAGLAAAATPWLLVIAGDMPYLTGELVDALLARATDGVDAVCVREGGWPEPLVSIVHARVRDVVERRLADGRYKASGLFTDENLAVAWHDVADARALRSINAPEDLRE